MISLKFITAYVFRTKLAYALAWITFYIFCVVAASIVFLYELPLPEERLTVSEDSWAATTLPDNWRHQEQSPRL